MGFSSSPLPSLTPPLSVSYEEVSTGQYIPPIDRVKLFSSRQWEEFILEWADSLKSEYSQVERCGGAGDMGRDIIAFDKTNTAIWDNYQCKHYDHSLAPSDIWVELGKLVYYTYQKKYTYPRQYFFIAPQGAGTKLSNLLKNSIDLKNELISNWDKYCLTKITSTQNIVLDTALRTYLDSLDFSIFKAISPLTIIEQLKATPWFVYRFGGGLPKRPPASSPPQTPETEELTYVNHLLDAYSDFLKKPSLSLDELDGHSGLKDHFNDSRIEFYSAEALKAFSRDNLPSGEFIKLQDEIHDGIKDEIRMLHPHGYQRVLSVVKTAKTVQITDHALVTRMNPKDRGGICHQLANENKVKWVNS